MFSRRVTSVARPAQYKSSRSEGSSGLIAEQKISMSPEPTASPAERSSDAKSTSTLTKPVRSKEGRSRAVRSKPVRSKPVRSGTGGDLLQIVPHHIEVVAFLHHGAQGVLGDLRAEIRFAEEVEGAYPVDRLGDPGWLGEVQFAQPVDGLDHLAGQRLGDARRADQHDLYLPLGGWVSDPVVQAASLQRVVQLTCAVGGEHHDRRALRLDRADLRDGDLEVGEDFE